MSETLDIEGLRLYMKNVRHYSYSFADSICARARRAAAVNITEEELCSAPPHILAAKIYGGDSPHSHKSCTTLQNQYAGYLKYKEGVVS